MVCETGGNTRQGFTKLTNLYVRVFARHLTRVEMLVLLHVIDRTAGWNQEEEAIHTVEFVSACGVSRAAAMYAVRALSRARVLIVTRSRRSGSRAGA